MLRVDRVQGKWGVRTDEEGWQYVAVRKAIGT
jgi:hypothetical protein